MARLSSVGSHAVAVRRGVLSVVGLIATVLGVWGFFRYSQQPLGADLGPTEWLYGTVVLFVDATDIAPVPWQLDIARLLAPLVTVGVVFEVLLVAFAQRIRRWAASKASGHVLLVGPVSRVQSYANEPGDMSASPTGRELVVHIGDEGSSLGAVTIGLPATSIPSEWVSATPANAARRMVLALGRDDLTLAAFRAALDTGLPADGSRLEVEFASPTLSGRMAVAVASERPSAEIEFVCPAEVDAQLIAAGVVEGLAGADPTGESWAVAVVGDTATCDRLAAQLVRAFTRSSLRGGAVRPKLLRVLSGQPRGVPEEVNNHRVVVHTSNRLDVVFDAAAPDHIVVDFADTERSARVAMQVALRRRGSTVWTTHGMTLPWATTNPEEPGSQVADLREVSLQRVARMGTLQGPFGRIASNRRKRLGPAAPGSTAADVRRGVSTLISHGWEVVPESDIPAIERQGLTTYVDPTTSNELRQVAGLGDDPSELLYELRCEGLLATPRGWAPEGDLASVDMPGDAVIDSLARQIHERYVAQQAGGVDLPALRAWTELDETFRALNRDQARDNVIKLARRGLRLVAFGSLSGNAVVLSDADIVDLGIAEHDRWSLQKREQGYRYGPSLVTNGPDLRHPSLIPWDELASDEQEKDLAAMRQMPDVLEAVGLAIERSTPAR
ncbi:MAG: hypothetical protein R2754_18890 [Microthrixaceae bacterium]